ncbi:hypothetical protein PCASD_10745 [Puccinia coronata f. sp. avenae]|uniref:Uncharacterized protein n=1 Tax=Puccinia coronata f. sp. avenae TaxID=200324 RepID=A0A2N5UTE8_9BASI|nr:hypothetical protein PCASD_10745 [Puccinia coronata f. sp. avenae]
MGRPRHQQTSSRVYPEYLHQSPADLADHHLKHYSQEMSEDGGDKDNENSSIVSNFPPVPPHHHHLPLLGWVPSTRIFFRRSAEPESSAASSGHQNLRTWSRGLVLTLTSPSSGLENHLNAFAVHNISAPNGSIYGSIVGIGASFQSLFVKDCHG